MQDPQAKLGQMYIEEYLRNKGFSWQQVCEMPPEQAKKLMVEASTYAAMKLTEVDARANVVKQIHDASQS